MERFDAQAAACLAEGARLGQRLFLFTPTPAVTPETGLDVTVLNPTDAFLGGGPLRPATMLNMFAEQTTRARGEGYTGIRVVADMAWLSKHPPPPQDIAAFELLLDHAVTELGATVVCAYRPGIHGASIAQAAAVHPLHTGMDEADAMFRLFSTGGSTWQLTGEIDMANLDAFERAARTAASIGPVTRLHCGGLEFISAAGLAVISRLAQLPAPHPMVIDQASELMYDCWHVLGLSHHQPEVTFGEARPAGIQNAAVAIMAGTTGGQP